MGNAKAIKNIKGLFMIYSTSYSFMELWRYRKAFVEEIHFDN